MAVWNFLPLFVDDTDFVYQDMSGKAGLLFKSFAEESGSKDYGCIS